MKTFPLIAFLMLAITAFSPGARAEEAAKDQPATAKCACCSATDKDGKTYGAGKDCCGSGAQAGKPAEKVIPKSSYNRKS